MGCEATKMSLHWARIKEAGAVTGMRVMVLIHAVLGRAVFRIILFPVMAYFYLRRGEARRSSGEYLRRCRRQYPDLLANRSLKWLSFRHFLTFGDLLLDKYLAWVKRPTALTMEPAEEKELSRVLEQRQGLLILGSHFGNLEYSRAISVRHPDLVINVLIYDQHASKFAKLMTDSEPASRQHLWQVTDLNVTLALDLKERVQRGEWVVIAGDRVPVGDSGRVYKTTFLGDEANFPIGPYVLAALLGCPVYLLYCYRKNGGYHMGFELFAEKVELPRMDRDKVLAQHVRHFAGALEGQLVRAPLQWFNFFDFWRDSSVSDRSARQSSGRS
jgi:predicted LPLAT superfamily acyltransferase